MTFPFQFIFFGMLFMAISSAQSYSQNDSTELALITKIAEQTREKYIIDKRTAVFDLFTDENKNVLIETTEAEAAKYFSEQLKPLDITTQVNTKVYPAAELGQKSYGLVNLSVVNIRSAPRHSAELATQVLLGTQLDLLKFESGYYLVRTPEGYISWLDHYAVIPKTSQDISQWKKTDKLVFTKEYGHVHKEANDNSDRISDLVLGNILIKQGEQNGYYHVSFPDGRMGFVPISHMSDYKQWINKPNPQAAEIINVAKKMVGVPYLWGGTSVKGVDCSGFTKTAFFMNGIIIPRDASQQVLTGNPVMVLEENNEPDKDKILNNLKAGDLLFFAAGKNTNPKARITHVALYIGNGEFIHAAGLVRINSLIPGAANFDETQYNTLVSARRFLGYIGMDGLTQAADHPAYRP